MSSWYTGASESHSTPWVKPTISRDSSWELISDPGAPAEPQLPLPPVLVQRSAADCLEAGIVPALYLSAQTRAYLLDCHDLGLLGEVDLPGLQFLEQDSELNRLTVGAKVRLARAVRAGLGAKLKLSGARRATVSSPSLGCPNVNTWYICLRAPRLPHGFLTTSYRTYWKEVKAEKGSGFHPFGVSHAFGSLAEVTAFLAGASAQWPQNLD